MQLVLTENRHLRIASFTIFYVAQGLPIGLLMIAIPAWLAGAGATATEIASYVSLAGLPWGLKLFAGPIMDRFSYLSMGRRRPWVVLSQSGLLLALFSMSLTPDPIDSIWLLSAMAFLVNMFAAVQDVAVDGMAIDVLEPDERGSANAFMACGQVVGFSGSGFVTAHALEYSGLALACFIVAFGVAFILLWSILIKERSMEKRLPWTQGEPAPRSIEIQAGSWREIFSNLIRVMFLPTSLILMTTALCWGMTQGVWESSAPVILTQELGYESTVYSSWFSAVSFVSAVLGLLLGRFIDRSGAQRFLFFGIAGLAINYLFAAIFSDYWVSPIYLVIIVCCYSMAGQMAFISFIALHMNVCWERVAATQFAIYMAWSNLSKSIGAGIYAQFNEYIALTDLPFVLGAICVLGMCLIAMIDMPKHQQQLSHVNQPQPEI